MVRPIGRTNGECHLTASTGGRIWRRASLGKSRGRLRAAASRKRPAPPIRRLLAGRAVGLLGHGARILRPRPFWAISGARTGLREARRHSPTHESDANHSGALRSVTIRTPAPFEDDEWMKGAGDIAWQLLWADEPPRATALAASGHRS